MHVSDILISVNRYKNTKIKIQVNNNIHTCISVVDKVHSILQ
jgi:hypothetical protein